MDKRILGLMVSFALLVAAGCGDTGDDNANSKAKTFVGGTDGITMEFLTGTPPPEVYDNSNFPFDVRVKLENQGEWDVSKDNVKVKISGIQAQDFGVQPAALVRSPIEDLEGAAVDPDGSVIPGTVTFLTFPEQGDLNYRPRLSGNTQFTIFASNCYTYGTTAQALLCMRDDIVKSGGDPGCIINEKKSVHSSGSPIQITSFEESAAGSDKVTFSFMVEHRGTGKISKKSTQCNDADTTLDDNKVWVDVSTGDITTGLTCAGLEGGTSSTNGYTTLFGGKRLIRCTQEQVAGYSGNYEKIARVQLIFDYKDSVSVPLLMKHSVD